MKTLDKLEPVFKNKKCFIFDLDCTLVDLDGDGTFWDSVKIKLAKLAENKYGQYVHFSPFYKAFDIIKEKFGEEAYNEFNSVLESEENLAISRNSIASPIGPILLQNIWEKYKIKNDDEVKICVLSNNFYSTIELALKEYNFADKVDFFYGRDNVKNKKPDPEGLKKISANANVDKSEMILFGDSDFDEGAAKNFGIDFIYIDKIAV